MLTTEERLGVIETKQDLMAEDISFIKQKLSNGLVTDVAILKESNEAMRKDIDDHKDGDKWLKRITVGAAITLLVAEILGTIF